MKNYIMTKVSFSLSFILIMTILNINTYAQKEIVRETRDVAAFDQLDAGGAFNVKITFGEPQKVEVESRQKDIGQITADVKDKKLVLSSKGVSNNTPLNIYITVPALTRIEAHGASDVEGLNAMKTDMLDIEASGAASVRLILDVNTLRSEVSGAADVKLSGTAQHHSTNVSGAGTLDAYDLTAASTDADASGAATAKINSENVTGKTSGAADISTKDKDRKTGHSSDEKALLNINQNGDTTYVGIPGANIVVTDGDDTVKLKVGNRIIIIDEDGNIKTKHEKWPKFNGDWAGVGIGFNGYVNKDFNMDFPKEYEYLDLRMEKSIAVNLNFFEQNIPLAKNQKWGLVTGLGLWFNDYKFLRPTRLSMDSSQLTGYLYDDISIRKSKISAIYLTLPVLFEFQTAPAYHKDGFHISTGVVIGARLSSHTKVYYNELNTPFNLTRYNPETGKYEAEYTGVSPNDPKEHHYGDWFLQPFKFDATVRIGWDFLNFWANYSLNTMFRKDKGPELYPWSAGITLVCF
jgi:hypothetical protein